MSKKLIIELDEEWEEYSREELAKLFKALVQAAKRKLAMMKMAGHLCPGNPDPVFQGDRGLVILIGLFKEGKWRIEEGTECHSKARRVYAGRRRGR